MMFCEDFYKEGKWLFWKRKCSLNTVTHLLALLVWLQSRRLRRLLFGIMLIFGIYLSINRNVYFFMVKLFERWQKIEPSKSPVITCCAVRKWLLLMSHYLKLKKQHVTGNLPLLNAFYLIHGGRGNMVAISQTTHSKAFSWKKMLEFRSIFHWSLFPRVQ